METIQMLGSLGEFVGAIAVVATLAYLAIQVRHSKEATDANTKSMDESRRLALAQAYQARADVQQDSFMRAADSTYLNAVLVKVQDEGLDGLTAEERSRYVQYAFANRTRLDNVHYQYQQGFIDEEFWQSLTGVLRFFALRWEQLGILDTNVRRGFLEEARRVMAGEQS